MRVTRLEIFGFKSFLDRLLLPLEAGITGVVGPNGCGKSNIVDALRWVLGETRASNLRGGTLEDVIFNGTDKLRPLGLAEVTISLRASGGDFFADLSAPLQKIIDTTPVPFAAESEAPLVQASALAAVEPAQEASETGRPQLTVIDGALASAKLEVSVEAGDVLKELSAELQSSAAAPAEDKSSRTIAESSTETAAKPVTKDLDPVQEAKVMLTRFAWLKSVQEVQVTRRLYRSGESEFFINRVACRLRDLKDLFRVIGLGARAYTIVAQGEVSRIVTARAEERRLIIEEAAGVAGFRDKIAAATRRLEETSVNIARLDDVIKEVTRQVNSLRVQASRARNREQLKARVAELEHALFKDSLALVAAGRKSKEADLLSAKRERDLADSEFERVNTEEQAARAAMLRVDVEGDSLRTKIDSIKEDLDQRGRRRGDFAAKLVELKAQTQARENEIRSLGERRQTLEQRVEAVSSEIQTLSAQEVELREQIGSLGISSEGELEHVAGRLDTLRQQLRQQDQAVRSLRDEVVSSEARSKALQEQIKAASPLNQLREALKHDLEEGGTANLISKLGDGVALFADCLEVPAELARAVQAVLAERAAYLITDEPFALARSFAEEVSKRPEDSRPALGVFASHGMDLPAAATLADVPFEPLLTKISVSSTASFAANRVFSGVFFCEDLEQAVAFFDERQAQGSSTQGIVLVTKAGELLSEFSFYSVVHEGGLIQLKREAIELDQALAALRVSYTAEQQRRDQLQMEIDQTQQQHSQVLRETQERQEQARELANQQGSVHGRLQAAERAAAQQQADIDSVEQLVEAAQEKLLDYARQSEELTTALESLEGAEEELLRAELDELREQYQTLDGERREARESLAAVSQMLEGVRERREATHQAVSRLALDVEKGELELNSLRELFAAEYGQECMAQMMEQVNALQDVSSLRLPDEERLASREEAQKLRSRIIREGEVDSTSIQRFEEERERLENLETQKKDLESAAATLKQTIERLTETSVKRFLETFAAVRDNFSALVPRLYGGGRGSLDLLNPENPLESGVEIVIRPPGKKLKTIDLMSGGEKALCAIGLIFALFLHRPSPLCVLDEVDAPLDEANLMRYLEMVKEMSKRTQFIMITHNKRSMAFADTLVGVTMQQPGASRILGVSLQEAYAHVA